jgi:hypothetical protein
MHFTITALPTEISWEFRSFSVLFVAAIFLTPEFLDVIYSCLHCLDVFLEHTKGRIAGIAKYATRSGRICVLVVSTRPIV